MVHSLHSGKYCLISGSKCLTCIIDEHPYDERGPLLFLPQPAANHRIGLRVPKSEGGFEYKMHATDHLWTLPRPHSRASNQTRTVDWHTAQAPRARSKSIIKNPIKNFEPYIYGSTHALLMPKLPSFFRSLLAFPESADMDAIAITHFTPEGRMVGLAAAAVRSA